MKNFREFIQLDEAQKDVLSQIKSGSTKIVFADGSKTTITGEDQKIVLGALKTIPKGKLKKFTDLLNKSEAGFLQALTMIDL